MQLSFEVVQILPAKYDIVPDEIAFIITLMFVLFKEVASSN